MEIFINELNYSYPKRDILFDRLNWHCPPGSIVGLLGKNGAGKSTLLRLLIGLLYPIQGNIKIGNYNPRERDADFLQQAFLLTDEIKFPPAITIKSYVKTLAPFYPLFSVSQFENILEDFGINKNSKLGSLSLGQQKKVSISFALSTNCKVLLFDEPTNGLDIPSKSVFRKVITSCLNENQTLIISTHLVSDVEKLIDRIGILNEGRFVLDADLIELSDQFYFGNSSRKEVEFIYSEKHLTGYQYIRQRKAHETQTPINLELLFNAVQKKGWDKNLIFQSQNSYAQ